MVVLTITATENGRTIYFDNPIRQPSCIKIMHNLKRKGKIRLHYKSSPTITAKSLLPGHGDIDNVKSTLQFELEIN